MAVAEDGSKAEKYRHLLYNIHSFRQDDVPRILQNIISVKP